MQHSPQQQYREIIKERRFERELRAIEANPHRADELLEGVEFTLARDPREGVQLAPQCPVWFMPVGRDNTSGIAVFYTFDNNRVILLSITQERAPDNQ